jgi:hypothetical protein
MKWLVIIALSLITCGCVVKYTDNGSMSPGQVENDDSFVPWWKN